MYLPRNRYWEADGKIAIMDVPDGSLTLSKAEAATRQVEAAIDALVEGRFDAAVTLAGAAEGMFKRKGFTFYNFMMSHPLVQELSPKLVNSHLNRARDWLKHPEGASTMEIGRAEAAEMIARAATKLEASDWTPKIDAFRSWFVANVEAIFK